MTTHHFIFSNRLKHRVARHIVFWTLWSLAFLILFHYPIHVFKGWDISGPGTRNYQQLGPVLFFIKAFFVNVLFAVVIPQIVLTYVLLYWLLPNYYYKKRNYLAVGLATAAVLVGFYFLAVALKYSPVVYNRITGVDNRPVPIVSMGQVVIIDQLSSLPIVLGFGLVIRQVKQWWLQQKETEQLLKEKTNAELQLLKAQVHPHFLFNTLNNIYFFTITNSDQAPAMIRRLSGILNYILHECDQPLVPLVTEIRIIRDYMALEKIRYGDQLKMTVDITQAHNGIMIAPLLLIPFVENSFKHGVSMMIGDPWVKLNLSLENNRLHFSLSNSKPADGHPGVKKRSIGLKNVTKRLELLYPGRHTLKFSSEPGIYSVDLCLQLSDPGVDNGIKANKISVNDHAMA